MVEKVFDNIWRIDLPLTGNPLKILNSYYIKGTEKEVVIDTGFRREECKEALIAGLKEIGANLDNIDVVATHMHSDHLGNAESVLSKDHHIYIDAIEIDRIRFFDSKNTPQFDRFIYEGYSMDALRHQMNKNSAFIQGLKDPVNAPFIPMNDGDVLDLGGFKLQWIVVPGHTPGNSMLWNEENKIMFTGDHILYDITPNITYWSDLDNSLGSYLENLKRADEYPVEISLPGHRQTGDYHERIKQLLKHHEARLNEAYECVKQMPGINATDLASHMTWKIRSKNWEEFPPIQKWFAIGEAMSHVDHLLSLGKVRREIDENNCYHYYAL